jgi:hypothetical protein
MVIISLIDILVDGLHERPEMKKGVGIPQVIELWYYTRPLVNAYQNCFLFVLYFVVSITAFNFPGLLYAGMTLS